MNYKYRISTSSSTVVTSVLVGMIIGFILGTGFFFTLNYSTNETRGRGYGIVKTECDCNDKNNCFINIIS